MLDAETAAYLENARKSALKGFPLSRVTEDFHDRMLESLPPIQMSGVPGFFVSEAYTDNVHAQFVHYRGRFYGAYVDVTDPESRIGRERIAAFHAEHSDDEPLTWYPEV